MARPVLLSALLVCVGLTLQGCWWSKSEAGPTPGDEVQEYCCFSGSNASDVCGSCYANAIAVKGTEFHGSHFCTTGKDGCESCKGLWCSGKLPATTPAPTPAPAPAPAPAPTSGEFCCFSGSSPEDMCGTCYPDAIAPKGAEFHGSHFCTADEGGCESCKGTWCSGEPPATTPAPTPEPAPAPAPAPAPTSGEFCCFSGSSPEDVCGTCYPDAIAPKGAEFHGSHFCTADEGGCESCKGTWCAGSTPVVEVAEGNSTQTLIF